jgi:uncharacterized protein YutD
MNNIQIDKILKKDKKSKKIYLGTFPFDKLPKNFKYPACFIINNQKSTEIGEHWLAIYFDSQKKCYFFDSFGMDPKFYNLLSYLKTKSTTIIHNKLQIQSFFSEYCGYYCIIFLLLKVRKYSLNFILSQFKDPESNDNLIKNLIKKNE